MSASAAHPGPAHRGRERAHPARVPPSALLVGLGCLVLAGIADLLLRHESGISGDERFYSRMAAHPSGPHNFPYAFRVGVPWLVHILPFSHVASFTALSLLAISTAGGAMFLLLGEFEIPERLAAGLSVGFALSPTLLVVLLRHGRSVDAAAVLVITAGTLFVVRRQRLAFALTLLAGTTIHESCLFLIPFAYAVWARRLIDRDAALDLVRVAAAPLVLYLVIRTQVRAVGERYIPGYQGSFLRARWDMVRSGLSGSELSQEVRRIAYAYGPLWLVAPTALKHERFARRGMVLVGLCLVSMTFAFGWGRIIFFAAPVFYVAAARVLAERRSLALAVVVALLAMDIGYAVYMQLYGVQHGIDTTITSSQRVPVF